MKSKWTLMRGLISKASLIKLLVFVMLFGLVPSGVVHATTEVSFNNASAWDFVYGRVVPSHPTANGGGGWYFDIPVLTNPISSCYDGGSDCPAVGYLETAYNGSMAGGTMSMTAQITTLSGTPTFNYQLESSNTCATPTANARFFMHYNRSDNFSEFGRWWSDPVKFNITPGGVITVNAPLDPAKWISVYGKRGNYDSFTLNAFNGMVATPGNIGLSFGGGCFAGHGVNVSGGTARMTVTDFSVKTATNVPVYAANSVVSSASAVAPLARRSWLTVYGNNLITAASCPAPTGVVTNLCGTEVKINGTAVQLSYASKTQINFLVPDTIGTVSMQVISSGYKGDTISLNLLSETMDLYAQNGLGTGTVAALHWSTPGVPQGTPVSVTYPAKQLYPLIIYASGLGSYGNTSNKPTIKINNQNVNPAYISYVGYTNGQYQINLDRMLFSELGISSTNTYSIRLCGGATCGNSLTVPITIAP